MTRIELFTVILERISFLNFSVLISNTIRINRYNPCTQKLSGTPVTRTWGVLGHEGGGVVVHQRADGGLPAQVRPQPQIGAGTIPATERLGLWLFRWAVQVSLPSVTPLSSQMTPGEKLLTFPSSFPQISIQKSRWPLPAPIPPRLKTRPGPGTASTSPCPSPAPS